MLHFLNVMKCENGKTVNSLGSRDCAKPHHNQPIKLLNEEECMQDTAQLNCVPGAGRHIAREN